MPLYPEIEPYSRQLFAVSATHHLYVEQSGNPEGIAAVFIHGGPGGGCNDSSRRFFDPARYRIICFDQRGCGRSTPYACLEDNNTHALVEDLEKIRCYLGIDQWLLFGGSWGSTLALCYAQTFSKHVLGLVLRGIFLARSCELEWLYQQGASRIYPEFWEDFIAPIPAAERGDLLAAYYRRLTSDDSAVAGEAAIAWATWEGRIATLLPEPGCVASFTERALAIARLECHYFVHQAFLSDQPLLNAMPLLAKIPGTIIQGRYDMVCPAQSAYELHKAWPSSELKMIDAAGHSASEAGIRRALVEATDQFAKRLSKD